MTPQNRTIMGSLDYCLESLHKIKQDLINNSDNETLWTVSSLAILLVAFVHKESMDIITESLKFKESKATDDLREIQKRFNDFIDRMVSNEN